VKPALIFMGLWGVGGSMMIYLAGLQGIPQELYEAAEIDGANLWRRMFHVTLPLLTPVIFFSLAASVASFSSFGSSSPVLCSFSSPIVISPAAFFSSSLI